MNDKSTTSVSKDCFFFGAKKDAAFKNTSKAGKDGACEERMKLGKTIWNEMETVVQSLHEQLQDNLFEQLLKFIVENRHVDHQTTQLKFQTKIPTAVLITGVNMPDHNALFKSLNNNINKNVSPHIVNLQARQCFNMKTLMKSLATQLSASSKQQGEEINEFERRGMLVTMSAIEEWYLRECEHSKDNHVTLSPSKRRKKSSAAAKRAPIVITFEDFEAFPQKLLHDFILTASFHAESIDFVFIFGVSTSWEEVSQRLLSHASLVHLQIIKFQAPSPSKHLSLIFDKILLTEELAFKLSGRCLQLALDVFLRYDFSITNFTRTLKFCVLEHFRKQPASIICQLSCAEAVNHVKRMKGEQLKSLVKLPSVQSYFMEEKSSTEIEEIFKNNVLVKKEMISLVERLYGYHDNYFVTIKCLNAMTRDLPNLPMGKQLREIYCSCHTKPLSDLPQYKRAFLFLNASNMERMSGYLKTCLNIVDEHLSHVSCDVDKSSDDNDCSPQNFRHKLNDFLQAINSNDKTLNYYDSDEYEEEEQQVEDMNKLKYTYQLQQRLRERKQMREKKKTKRKTRFEKMRDDFLDFCDNFFQRNLRPPVGVPLYEAFYFDCWRVMSERLMPSPRLNIETALTHPYYYLKVKELKDGGDFISESLPDLSIVYKLHLESPSLINLYDWMKAFHVMVTSASSDEIDELTQARFIQAVSELELMGFIKPTKKKIDHIQRLTWA